MKLNHFGLLMILLAFAMGGMLLFWLPLPLTQLPSKKPPKPRPKPPVVVSAQLPLPTNGTGLPPTKVVRSLHQKGRPALWLAKRMNLGSSGYVASVGPMVYQDEVDDAPDYYSIDVEKPDGSGSYVLFQQDFTIDEIPELLIDSPISKIVAFDAPSGTVIFQIGDQVISFQIPELNSTVAP